MVLHIKKTPRMEGRSVSCGRRSGPCPTSPSLHQCPSSATVGRPVAKSTNFAQLDRDYDRTASIRRAKAVGVYPFILHRALDHRGVLTDAQLDAWGLADVYGLPEAEDNFRAGIQGMKDEKLLTPIDDAEHGLHGWELRGWWMRHGKGRPRPVDDSYRKKQERAATSDDVRPRPTTGDDVQPRPVCPATAPQSRVDQSRSDQTTPEKAAQAPARTHGRQPETSDVVGGKAGSRAKTKARIEADVVFVFDAWVKAFDVKEQAALRSTTSGKQRCTHIRARLRDDNYTRQNLLDAIQGLKRSKWHAGDNPEGKVYQDVVHFAGSSKRVDDRRELPVVRQKRERREKVWNPTAQDLDVFIVQPDGTRVLEVVS